MSIRNKIITTIIGLSLVVVMVPSGVVQAALTSAQVDAIISLLQSFGADATTIANVQASLTGGTPAPTGTGNYQGIPAGFTFTRNITVGTVSQDVVYLKAVLIGEGCGNGITNTTYYGPHTVANVQCFQNKYKTQISAFAGYTIASTGLVGTGTRAQLNVLISSTTPPVVPPTTAGGLSVALASGTPASATVIDNTSANYTKFTLTAGSAGAVSISKIYVTRGGLSANATVENIKIVDAETGGYKGSVGSLNVDNRSMITFSPALVIPAGTTKTYYIRAGIVDGLGSGSTVTMGIAANTDIVSNATSVTGAPVVGNPMTVVLLAVGTLTISEDVLVDSQPNAGATDVPVSGIRLAAGSTENVVLESITALKSGTTDVTDTANIELYDVTHSTSLATVASWDAEEKVTFSNLNLTIAKGATLRLQVRLDIIGGVASTAKTVTVDVVDGSDVLVTAKGSVYGAYITLTNSWTDSDGVGTTQTINKGALNISKSASTPAVGKIAVGSDVVLGKFDFDAKGEEMRVTSTKVEATFTTMTYDQITAVKLYDENGTIVAGPKDMTDVSAGECYVTFTDTYIVPIGIHTYTVKAKIADAATGTIVVRVNDPSATTLLVVKGMTSGDSITGSPAADVLANTLTVAAGALKVTTLPDPAARSVAKGTTNFLWATFSLDASGSGEDVNVTSITPTVINAVHTDEEQMIDNASLWADLTSANSARGDIYETKITDSKQWLTTVHTQAFPLTQTLVVKKDSFVKVGLVADLNAGASTDATYYFEIAAAADLDSTGATTGATIAESPVTHSAHQAMVVSAGGALTISKDASSPVADLVLGNSTVTLAVFRLAASNVENLDVDDVTLTVTGGAYVGTYYFYNGTTLLGTAPGGTAPKLTLTDGTLTVPANSNVKLTVKAAILPVDGSVVTNGVTVLAGITTEDAVNTTGLGAGSGVDSNEQTAAASTMVIVKAKPVVALASGSPSGILYPSTAQQLAVFNVTAVGADDVTLDDGETNLFTIEISRKQGGTSDGTAGAWLLKDEAGTTLSSINVADTATRVTFLFATNEFNVSPGDITKKLYVYGDTHEYTTQYDSIQLWLNDSDTDAGDAFSYSVNGGTTIPAAAYVFRGNIYGGTFSRP